MFLFARSAVAVLVGLLLASCLLAQEQQERRPPAQDAETRMLDNLLRLPADTTLTEEQQAKLNALRKKLSEEKDTLTRALEIQNKLSSIYTPQQLDARRKAFTAARDAGKDAGEARRAAEAAVKLSDEQKAEIAQLQADQQKLTASVRGQINLILGRQPGQAPQRTAARIAPTHPNVKYGPHERNVFDFWQAESDRPTPVLVSIHGGGFRGGNKSVSGDLLDQCLKAGISVAAITYRLSQDAIAPASFTDSARCIQFIRSKAKEWNLDPKRMAATGGSAGAGISLWLGFHDDMADDSSGDPVLRQSTRLSCVFVSNGQTSYDPRFIRDLFPGTDTYQHPALAQLFDVDLTMLDDLSEEKYRLFEECSALPHLTKDDPPVILSYNGPIDAKVTNQSIGIHHARFGQVLKERMDKLGIHCEVHAPGENQENETRTAPIEFLKQQFGLND